MQNQNVYYRDLITGKTLRPAKVRLVPKGGFTRYMESIGKLGGQNKIQRLSDNRNLVTELIQHF